MFKIIDKREKPDIKHKLFAIVMCPCNFVVALTRNKILNSKKTLFQKKFKNW